MDLCEFKASLLYTVSTRTARNPVSETKQKETSKTVPILDTAISIKRLLTKFCYTHTSESHSAIIREASSCYRLELILRPTARKCEVVEVSSILEITRLAKR